VIYLPPRRDVDVQQIAGLVAADGDAPVDDYAKRLDWAFDRCLAAYDEAARRGLAERPQLRRDTCPECGAERFELVVVPDRFYCRRCKIATEGPNTEAPAEPEPEQIDLFEPTGPAPTILDPQARAIAKRASDVLEAAVEEAPPIDEGMAWVGEEAPDE
jgi:hypothetical protein